MTILGSTPPPPYTTNSSPLLCKFTYLWPHAVRYATEHQGTQTLGAWKHRINELPGQVAHRVVVGELQVGLPAQSLLWIFTLG